MRDSLKHKLKSEVLELKGEHIKVVEMSLGKRLKMAQMFSNKVDFKDINFEIVFGQCFYNDNSEPLFSSLDEVNEIDPLVFQLLVDKVQELSGMSSKSVDIAKKN